MFRRILFFLSFIFLFFAFPKIIQAQTTQQYSRGKIEKIIEQTEIRDHNGTFYIQKLEVKKDSGESVEIPFGSEQQPIDAARLFAVHDRVILVDQPGLDGNQETIIADRWRIPIIWWLGGLFFLLVIIVARQQGVSSIFGMIASVGILINFIIPQILAGAQPLLISLIGVVLIGGITMYLTHGWKLESHLALASILVTMGVVALLSMISVRLAHLTGMGDENAFYIQFNSAIQFNLKGLLLGGILLGALGVLDDICVAQVSVVRQLLEVNKKISLMELYQRSMAIGKDHVASLVNTLVLAYAGANLPLFLLFFLNKDIPIWVTLNQEIIIEEVVRTFAGSIGLVLAVPLTTVMAAWVLYAKKDHLAQSGFGHRH